MLQRHCSHYKWKQGHKLQADCKPSRDSPMVGNLCPLARRQDVECPGVLRLSLVPKQYLHSRLNHLEESRVIVFIVIAALSLVLTCIGT
jgi:hypothetical protein